jgi:cbb3-type cytochrome oxidase maturation protein
MALALGLTGLAAFLWSLRNGQYEDMGRRRAARAPG